MNTGVLVLAAGFSRRFEGDKRLYHAEGDKPLLQMTVENVLAAGLPCRVCIRPEDEQVRALLRELAVQPVDCSEAQRGMGATLSQGIAAVADWAAVLIALGDMAWVVPTTYRDLAARLQAAVIVQPEYDGQPGNPVGFASSYYPQLLDLTGDEGGRAILRKHADALLRVPVTDPGIHRDLDYIS